MDSSACGLWRRSDAAREGAALVNSQTPVPLVTDQVIFSSSFGFKTPFFSVPASTIAALALWAGCRAMSRRPSKTAR